MAPDLSLIIPCFDEATHLRRSVDALLGTLDGSRLSYEVVFVDDGSTDGTCEILEEIVAAHDHCRQILHPENRGRGAAVKTGFADATGRVTGFIDIDLEVDPLYIPKMVSLIDDEGYDVATGHRYYTGSQTKTLIRNILSRGYRWIIRMTIGFDVRDSETGYKFFKRSTSTDVVLGSENDGWFWDTEVMARASLAGLRIIEFPVLFLRRPEIPSTVRIFRDTRRYLSDLRRFRKGAGFTLRKISPIYWTGVGYDAVMRLLYRSKWSETYAEVAHRIPDDVTMVDVCAGTARVYRDHLKERGVTYTALDFNPHLVMSAQRRGVDARRFDMRRDRVPEADYVIMCSSLYHFRDIEDDVIERLRRAAQVGVIISEPVNNISHGEGGLLRRAASSLTNPGYDSDFAFRYDTETLQELADRHQGKVDHEPHWRNAVVEFSPLD